jgi:hypothetical protein
MINSNIGNQLIAIGREEKILDTELAKNLIIGIIMEARLCVSGENNWRSNTTYTTLEMAIKCLYTTPEDSQEIRSHQKMVVGLYIIFLVEGIVITPATAKVCGDLRKGHKILLEFF